jgi:hypothetical protein
MPLILTKAPGQKPCLAIESLAMAGGGPAKIRPVRRRPWPGKGWGRWATSPKARLRQELVLQWHRRCCAEEPGGVGRGGLMSGERQAR